MKAGTLGRAAVAGGLAACLLVVAAATGTGAARPAAPGRGPRPVAAPRRAPVPPPVAPRPVEPVRAEFDAALSPGLGDTTQARLERFLATRPRSPYAWSAHLELGQLHYARGDYDPARAHFHHARGGTVADEAAYWEGLSAYALGRPHEARDAVAGLARARRGSPRQWDAAYLVALSWAQEGRRPEALSAYRALLAMPAGSGEAAALFQAQALARELKEADEAEQWSRRLIDRYPDSPEAASLRADARRAEEARQAGAAAPPAAGDAARPARPADHGGR